MKDKIIESIYNSIEELNRQLAEDNHLEKSVGTVLFGNEGRLDSLSLVNLLVIIEQNIEDEFDISLTIADERAMSQKQSPFKNIGTLANYLYMLLKEIKESS
jgi:D-alanine--poly(phosphoribitol) ligase subunit 2